MKRIRRYAAACLFLLSALMPALSARAVPFSTATPQHPAAVAIPARIPAPASSLSPLPEPEPEILLLLGAGLLCIGIKRQRKTKKAE